MVFLESLRSNYALSGLHETDLLGNPFQQFQLWLEQAIAAELPEPNAMTLATLSKEGKPIARMVLLKGLDEKGFVFYTNYDSAKGKQLTETDSAALVFWWAGLERQVRVEGMVEKVSSEESDAYFQSRPKASQLGALASPQSQVIENRDVLEKRLAELEEKYATEKVPRPPHWGGFRVIPTAIEFWQGRPSRLHDRIRYELGEKGNWFYQRLAP
ncbi:MAG: pyridoxamine 5'-phosphate oxidase [Snowella sp.]